MLETIKSIFTPSVVNKTVDGIYNGVDKSVYTDEEKADNLQKQAETKINLLPLFEPFKVAQRVIAISFTINFIIWVWIGVMMLILGYKEMLDDYVALLLAFNIGWIMMAIITWYFTGGVINSFKNDKTRQG